MKKTKMILALLLALLLVFSLLPTAAFADDDLTDDPIEEEEKIDKKEKEDPPVVLMAAAPAADPGLLGNTSTPPTMQDVTDAIDAADVAIDDFGSGALTALVYSQGTAQADWDLLGEAVVALGDADDDLHAASVSWGEATTAEGNAATQAGEAKGKAADAKDKAETAETNAGTKATEAGNAAQNARDYAGVAADTWDRATAWTYAYNADAQRDAAAAAAKEAAAEVAAAQKAYNEAQQALKAAQEKAKTRDTNVTSTKDSLSSAKGNADTASGKLDSANYTYDDTYGDPKTAVEGAVTAIATAQDDLTALVDAGFASDADIAAALAALEEASAKVKAANAAKAKADAKATEADEAARFAHACVQWFYEQAAEEAKAALVSDPAYLAEYLLGDTFPTAMKNSGVKLTSRSFVEYVFQQGGKTLKLDGTTLNELVEANGTLLKAAERGALLVLFDRDGKVDSFGIANSAGTYIFYNEETGRVEKLPLKDVDFSAIKVK